MNTKRTAAISVSVALTALMGAVIASPAAAVEPKPSQEPRVSVEYFPEPGGEGRRTDVPLNTDTVTGRSAARSATPGAGTTDGQVGELSVTGSSADRLDVVIVGDGYTADQQDAFHTAAATKWADITNIEPYSSYQGLMNVWTVDAVSAESGITGDPTADVTKDTALGSYFWCSETERLICADIDKVASYAAKAPEADLVVVVSNSTKYGGAGLLGAGGGGLPVRRRVDPLLGQRAVEHDRRPRDRPLGWPPGGRVHVRQLRHLDRRRGRRHQLQLLHRGATGRQPDQVVPLAR